jgi:hypothetical protein
MSMDEKVAIGCAGEDTDTSAFYRNLAEAGITDLAEQDDVVRAARAVCPDHLRGTTIGTPRESTGAGATAPDRVAGLKSSLKENFRATTWGPAIAGVIPMGEVAVVLISDPSFASQICQAASSLVFTAGSMWTGLWIQGPDGSVLIKREDMSQPC